MTTWKERLFLTKHQKMEQFSIAFLCLSISAVLMLCLGLYQSFVHDQSVISDKAMFNTRFKTSKTNTSGKVVGVYSNTNKTKTMVMLKFEDTDRISIDANNYNMFVTAADVSGNMHRIKSAPIGSVYVFGDTGYVGLYLVNNAGFDKQILQITVRANLELVKQLANQSQGDEKKKDQSFEKFDQFNVYCNPGAEKAITISALNTDGMPDASEVYRDTVGSMKLEELKLETKASMSELEIGLNKVKEHTKRMENNNIEFPELSRMVVGDVISHTGKKSDIKFDYKFETNAKGALEFDWQNNTFKEGFIKPAMQNYKDSTITSTKDFLMTQALDAKENKTNLQLDIRSWKLTDGRVIEDLNTTDVVNDEYTQINKVCQDYVTVLSDYYRDKINFQTKQLRKFLQLESEVKDINELCTIHQGDDVLKVY